jgi:hypothetical protein
LRGRVRSSLQYGRLVITEKVFERCSGSAENLGGFFQFDENVGGRAIADDSVVVSVQISAFKYDHVPPSYDHVPRAPAPPNPNCQTRDRQRQ